MGYCRHFAQWELILAKPVWTDAQIINQIDSGDTWSGVNLTYAFPTEVSWYPYDEKNGFSALNANQRAVATEVIHLWDDLIVPNFTLSNDAATANIRYANTTTTGDYAHAWYPGGAEGGTVWFDPIYDSSTGTNDLVNPVRGEWGYTSYIHETGHAFGLNHPGNYNGGDPTYANDALYTHDTQMYTVMSYFTSDNTGADWIASNGHEYYPQTPMMDDIMVIQTMYGADTTTRSGNTTYGFNSNAGDSVYNFSLNQHPVLCIYDAGGGDMLDLSGWNTSCRIDLTPGSFSDAATMTDNISIARNTWIESAAGGGGNDTILGNSISNALAGNAGDDIIRGGAGDDFIYGGGNNDTLTGGVGNDQIHGDAGTDTAIFQDNYANFVITYDAVNGDYILSDAILGTDKVWDVESFVFTDTTVAANFLNLTLNGTAGADHMTGAMGNDIYVVNNIGDIVDETSRSGVDTVQSSITFSLLDTSHVLGNVENLMLTGTASIDATGNMGVNSLVGNAGNNIIRAAAGDDKIEGLGGSDTLTGGLGNDTFIFRSGSGVDTITDFAAGSGASDVIELHSSTIHSLTDVLANATDVTGGVLISLGNGDSLMLNNVHKANLATDDFSFLSP